MEDGGRVPNRPGSLLARGKRTLRDRGGKHAKREEAPILNFHRFERGRRGRNERPTIARRAGTRTWFVRSNRHGTRQGGAIRLALRHSFNMRGIIASAARAGGRAERTAQEKQYPSGLPTDQASHARRHAGCLRRPRERNGERTAIRPLALRDAIIVPSVKRIARKKCINSSLCR